MAKCNQLTPVSFKGLMTLFMVDKLLNYKDKVISATPSIYTADSQSKIWSLWQHTVYSNYMALNNYIQFPAAYI